MTGQHIKGVVLSFLMKRGASNESNHDIFYDDGFFVSFGGNI